MTRALSVFIRMFILSGLMAAGVFAATSASAQVGTFQFVIGDVRVRNAAGVERPAVQGATVNERDTIVSGATGEAQLLMVDNAFVAVRRNTELRIDQYTYKGRNDGTESGVLHLVKGTFRALTGLIVRNNKQNFTMKTAVSTIGIRGTHIASNFNIGTQTNEVGTLSGEIFLQSEVNGRPIGLPQVLPAGTFGQAQFSQPAVRISTPSSELLASMSSDPKAAKPKTAAKPSTAGDAKPDAKPPARLASLENAEDNTRVPGEGTDTGGTSLGDTGTGGTGTAGTGTGGTGTGGTGGSGDGGGGGTDVGTTPSLAEQQFLLASLRQQIEGAFLAIVAIKDGAASNAAAAQSSLTSAQNSVTAAQASVTAAQNSATAAQTSATSAAGVAGADLTTLDTKIASASSLLAFAPSIQPSVTAAQSSRTTAFNSAGVVSGTLNPASSLAGAQTAAQTAATSAQTAAASAAAQVPTAQTAVATAQTAVADAQAAAAAANTALAAANATYQAALAAITAGDIALALQKLADLQQVDAVNVAAAAKPAGDAAASATTAASTASTAAGSAASSATTAASSATTAANQLTAANSAVSTANTAVVSGIASADSAINVALGNINAIQQAAAQSSTNAAASVTTIQGLQTNVNTVNTNITAINLVDTAPATTAIGTATTAIGNASSGATQAVNTANALSLASSKSTSDSNATAAASLKATTDTTVTNAVAVHDANANVTNGVGGNDFRDATAIAAKTAMDTAKATLNTANTQVQTAKTTIDTQVTTLANEKTAATTALGNANTALGSATTSLGTANTQNTNITNAKTAVTADVTTINNQLGIAQTAAGSGTTTLDPAPTTASSTFASGCGSALACSDLATQYVNAAVAAVPGSVAQANASNNALTAQGRAATFEQTAALAVTAAQTAANDAPVQLAAAQKAFTAGTTAAGAAATSAGTGATGAQGYAVAANNAAGNAQTAFDLVTNPTTGALKTSNDNKSTVDSQATTVAQQSIIAQYSNPTIANTGTNANRFGSTIRAPREVATGQYERVFGESDTQPNTSFVLDGNKNLVQHRDTSMLSTPGVVGPSFSYTDTSVKFSGGTAFDNAVLFDPANPNYMALGRWAGGIIEVDDQANGVGVDQTINLGPRSVHWGIAFAPPPGYVQNLTGTTTYTKLANTSPTDGIGTVGTLNSATLSADFAAQTVNAGVNLTIAGKTLGATASNLQIVESGFSGNFNSVTCSTGCTYNGVLDGTFAGQNAAAAAFGYDLWSGTNPYTDLIQGVVAFSTGTPPPLAPKPDANIGTAYLYSGSLSATTFQASGTSYSLDASGNLTQVAENPLVEPDFQESQTISGATTPTQGTPVTTAGGTTITYGRWQGGSPSVSGTDFSGPISPARAVDGAYHWIKGPPIGPFFLTEALALTGATSYTAQGGFVTDQSGTLGTLDLVNTTLGIDFSKQSVNFEIRATTGANIWRGIGSGVALEDGGQFFAVTDPNQPHRNMAVLFNGDPTNTFGLVDGTLMGNGADAAGMAFAFSQSTNRAVGTVALTGAVQSPVPITVGILAAGKLGAPLSLTGTPLTGTTTLASLDPEFVNTVEGFVNASSRVTRDANGSVAAFDAMIPVPMPLGCSSSGTACTGVTRIPGLLSINSASAFPVITPPDTGSALPSNPTTGALAVPEIDPDTSIMWGRYVGYFNFTDRIGATTGTGSNSQVPAGLLDARNNSNASNIHGIWSPSLATAPVLPTTGSVTYTLVGGTRPSDSTGALGTAMATATLSADFLNKTVNTTVNTGSVGGRTWTGTANNIPIVQQTYFQADRVNGVGNLNVTCSGCAAGATSGRIVGVFVGNHAVSPTPAAPNVPGAMMGYSFNQGGATGITVQGVSAFKKP